MGHLCHWGKEQVLWAWGSEFRAIGSVFGALGLGLRCLGSWFAVLGSGFGALSLGLGFIRSGFRVLGYRFGGSVCSV